MQCCVKYILFVLYMKYFLKRLCVQLKCVYFPTDVHCDFQRYSLKKKIGPEKFIQCFSRWPLYIEVIRSPLDPVAPHSSALAWKIPWMEEPGRLQSMVSLRVGQDWATSLWLFTFMHWRRKWQPTPVFLPGESQGQESLVGCCLWGCTESDTTEAT